ncbi:MAG: serine hydrolase [Paracoccaceae bacterium]
MRDEWRVTMANYRQLRAGLGLLRLLAAIFLISAGGAGEARAANYAAVVMDMRSGEVVHSHDANRRQHPASLTKMMTLYLTFEALENGQLRLDQRVRVSKHAARQPPSKLGMRPGQRVTIRHLIRATAIKSANDAAMVLAEAIGGSKRKFARMMTAKARDLGMRNTTFKNPHGLTEQGHLSTAQDMAQLARHLYYDYPKYYNVFGRKKARAAGKWVHTTNRLLSGYRGAEGMKTGYTRAAGYNLVAVAARGDRRVIGVIFGGKSSRTRNAHMEKLLDRGFRDTPRYAAERPPRRGRAAVALATAPLPQSRPEVAPTGLAALTAAVSAERAGAATRPGSAAIAPTSRVETGPLAEVATAAGAGSGTADADPEQSAPRPSATPAPPTAPRSPATHRAPKRADTPIARPSRGTTVDPAKAIRVASASGTRSTAQGARAAAPLPEPRPGWSVQLGVFLTEANARARLAAKDVDHLPMIARVGRVIEPGRTRAGKTLYKARLTGLDQEAATQACARVRKSGRDCLAIAPRR